MAKQEKDKPSLEDQVLGLKRQFRRHQIFSLITTVFLILLVVITFFRRDFPQLRTGALHIMGAGGSVISLQTSPTGSGTIVTRDQSGRPLVELSRTESAGTITTFHKDGGAIIELGNTPNGGSLSTFNNHEKLLIRLSKTGYGGDISLFSEEDGKPSLSMTTLGQGGAQVVHQKGGNLLR
jgi:hypothetical protein